MTTPFSIFNKAALDELRARAAGAVHTLALAKIHGRSTKEGLAALQESEETLKLVYDQMMLDARLVAETVELLRNMKDAIK
jgi:hypothetical protein